MYHLFLTLWMHPILLSKSRWTLHVSWQWPIQPYFNNLTVIHDPRILRKQLFANRSQFIFHFEIHFLMICYVRFLKLTSSFSIDLTIYTASYFHRLLWAIVLLLFWLAVILCLMLTLLLSFRLFCKQKKKIHWITQKQSKNLLFLRNDWYFSARYEAKLGEPL